MGQVEILYFCTDKYKREHEENVFIADFDDGFRHCESTAV